LVKDLSIKTIKLLGKKKKKTQGKSFMTLYLAMILLDMIPKAQATKEKT